jgi:protein-disulfide isomerase
VPLLEQVLEKYPDEVKIVFKNFPVRSHKFAEKAATAALAADRYGKFWEFHDLLFKNYNKLNDQIIGGIALGLGFDPREFQNAMKDPTLRKIIQQDVLDGREVGVRGTPTIFINGRRLKKRSLEGFQSIIDKLLQNLAKTATKPSS